MDWISSLLLATVRLAIPLLLISLAELYGQRAGMVNIGLEGLASIGALVGIAFAMGGFPIMDSVASVVICLFIVKAAVDIFRDAVNKMVDRSCDQETLEKMSQLILAQPGVEGLDLLQTRLFGAKIYVDAEIAVQADLPLRQAHAIAEAVHDAMEEAFPMVKHCMVHVNPANP